MVDDHQTMRHGLAMLITALGYNVLFECSNGREMTDRFNAGDLPQLVLMDINMPEMDGYAATLWLHQHHPAVHVLALSMLDDESAIIRMLKNGAKGYILKESEPDELKRAISNILQHGVHYTEKVTGKLLHALSATGDISGDAKNVLDLTEREIAFLKLSCTEMTYKEIAAAMHLSPRTIDGYRDSLFEKLNIRSRTGLVLFAIKHNIIQVS